MGKAKEDKLVFAIELTCIDWFAILIDQTFEAAADGSTSDARWILLRCRSLHKSDQRRQGDADQYRDNDSLTALHPSFLEDGEHLRNQRVANNIASLQMNDADIFACFHLMCDLSET